MSDNTPAVRATPTDLVRAYSDDFASVLPSHVRPETWVRLAQGALRRNKDLADAATRNPGSLMVALLDAARLGLEPGTEQYYLVPFNNRKAPGGIEVTGIVGYQGEIELIYRAGAVKSVKAEVVYEADTFRWSPNTMERPEHETDPFSADRGAIRGAYAYGVMQDGSISRVVVIGAEYIGKVRKMSKGSDSEFSPWVKWYDQMVLKTTIHLLAKWVPTSSEYRKEQLRAVQEVAMERARAESHTVTVTPTTGPPADAGEVVDGEVDPELPSAEEEQIPDATPADPTPDNPDVPVNAASVRQIGYVHKVMGEAGLDDDDRHLYAGFILGRPVPTFRGISSQDASLLIENAQADHKEGKVAATLSTARAMVEDATATADPADDPQGTATAPQVAPEPNGWNQP